MAKKKSPNKWVTWGKGACCENCGKCDYRFIKEIKTRKIRVMHFYCVRCLAESLKYCDCIDLKELVKGGKKSGKSRRKT